MMIWYENMMASKRKNNKKSEHRCFKKSAIFFIFFMEIFFGNSFNQQLFAIYFYGLVNDKCHQCHRMLMVE